MDRIPRPARPTLTDPSAGSGPQDLGLRMRTSGGPTQINLAWHSLTETAEHLAQAGEISRQQWQSLVGAGLRTAVNSPVPLHWRIPPFGVRLVGLTARALAFSQLVEHGATAVSIAHQQYRTAEGSVQRLMQLTMHLAETGPMLEHLVDADGDTGLVYDWGVSTVLLFGGAMLTAAEFQLARRVKGFGPAAAVLKVMADRHGLAAYEMGHHRLHLADRIAEFNHTGDGTYTGYLEQMAEVGEAGDLAVTAVTDDDGGQNYLVHLPGLDLDLEDINRDDGRGYLGLVDAAGNDSEQLAEVVDEALRAAGADQGDTIAISGYSMGGLGAVNLARSTGLREKYDLKAIATVASPGQNKTIPAGPAAVHFQEGRDPVTHIFGEHHQEGVDRLTITYEHHNEEIQSDSPFGGAHDYGHHQGVVEEIEAAPDEHLTEDEQALMGEFAGLYDGEAETVVFDSGWEELDVSGSEVPGEEVFDGQSIDEIVEESLAEVEGAPGAGGDGAATEDHRIDGAGDGEVSGAPVAPTPTEEDPVSVAPGEVPPRSLTPAVIGPSGPAQPGAVPNVPPRVIDPEAVLRQELRPETLTPAVIESPVAGDSPLPGDDAPRND